jgi:hypothetical protein
VIAGTSTTLQRKNPYVGTLLGIAILPREFAIHDLKVPLSLAKPYLERMHLALKMPISYHRSVRDVICGAANPSGASQPNALKGFAPLVGKRRKQQPGGP